MKKIIATMTAFMAVAALGVCASAAEAEVQPRTVTEAETVQPDSIVDSDVTEIATTSAVANADAVNVTDTTTLAVGESDKSETTDSIESAVTGVGNNPESGVASIIPVALACVAAGAICVLSHKK